MKGKSYATSQNSYGFKFGGLRCERSVDLQDMLRQALDDPRPALVTIPIDYPENALLTQRLGDIAYTF